MNNQTLLLSAIRSCREYTALTDALVVSRRRAVRRPVCVNGLCEGAQPLFLSALTGDETASDRRVLLLYSSDRAAADEAMRLSEQGIPAYHFPVRDYQFHNSTASRDFERGRLLVLSALLFSEAPFVVCATVEAVLQTTVPPEDLIHLTYTVDPERPLDTERLAEILVNGGYTRVELVEGPGQFAMRGGIIDVYPPAEAPVRIELFGDEIDRMGNFDPATQRFTEAIYGPLRIPPAGEILPSGESRELIRAACEKQLKKVQGTDNARAADILKTEIAVLDNGGSIGFADKYLPLIYPEASCFLDYYDGLAILCDAGAVQQQAQAAEMLTMQTLEELIGAGELHKTVRGTYIHPWARMEKALEVLPSVLIDPFARTHAGLSPAAEFHFETRHIPAYAGNTALLEEDLAQFAGGKYRTAILCANEAEAGNISDMLTEAGYTAAVCNTDLDFYSADNARQPVAILYGDGGAGFELTGERFAFLNYSGMPGVAAGRRKRKKAAAKKNREAILSYSDLTQGDYVVHEAYGIGLFEGIENLTVDGMSRDYVKIKYAGTDQLFLPVDQLDLLSKYIGAAAEGGGVRLSKMGGSDWTRAKSRASASAKEMAKELIELYARRRRAKGIAFPPEDDMGRQFAAAFPYEETDSQLTAIADVKRDMEADYPMDRIICGDVGYGKTEVALRAAFKAVSGGCQVAILVPTTILAYQHYQTALSRFRGFPVTVDMLSRFRSKAQQTASLRRLRRGETDIVIGTHRLISEDITFKNLGLVIVDEEQRFGVAQKEKLKEAAIGADMLTLTATPIPRTLNMAMGGILDMSVLDDVPGMRSPVQTYVMEHEDGILYEAIRRELRRGGQVFYLNNNVEYLYTIAGKLGRAIPEARCAVAHGRMDRDELEEVWEGLVEGEIDVLICTTIIETGVDIPNANTLIIENADRFGLSQLHQIRGRVGRSNRRAYAYFTYPKMKQLSEIADKRLQAIREYAAFGAGFKIALRDLEIRGAGNLLGEQQHGHMEAVGYDMYIKLLEEAVLEEKGEEKKVRAECAVSVRADAYLPKSYIRDQAQRMEMYRKIARIQCEEDFSDMIDELCDRFGDPPRSAMMLCRIALLRGLGVQAGMEKIEERDRELMLCSKTPDLTAVQQLSGKYPGAIRMTIGAVPVITVKKPRGVQTVDFLCDLLTEYIQFLPTEAKE